MGVTHENGVRAGSPRAEADQEREGKVITGQDERETADTPTDNSDSACAVMFAAAEPGASDLIWSAVPRQPTVLIPAWKRGTDVVASLLGLMLLSPLFLLLAAYIKSVSAGPVFFRHLRYGAGGRPFHVWKFRTMHHSSDPTDHQKHVGQLRENDALLTKMDQQYRLIRGGRWLRALAVDELPQLLNVLAGEMSLVGPRPDVVPMSDYEPQHRIRFDVLPGMTGLWQVSGKNKTTFSEMMALDRRYVECRSPMFDLAIVAWTLPAVIKLVVEDRISKAAAKKQANSSSR